jgi:hypothetical protein
LARPYRVFPALARGADVSTVDNPEDLKEINILAFFVRGILTFANVSQAAI